MKNFLSLALVALLSSLTLAPAQKPDASSILAKTDQILREVARLRELEPKGPIPRGVKSRDEIEEFILRQMATEYPEEKIRADEIVYKRLGLLDSDADLRKLIVTLLTEQIAGFYDPEAGTLYIADHVPEEQLEPVLAHELTHALQDQYFDLKKFRKEVPADSDEAVARAALIEGEGVAVMIDYSSRGFGRKFQDAGPLAMMFEAAALSEQSPGMAAMPVFLRETLIFPYAYGVDFLQVLRKKEPWSAVARLYQDPPRSSEQILHPAKYYEQRDQPRAVTIRRPAALSDWTATTDSQFGEFGLRQVLSAFLPKSVSYPAAAGWGGDAYQLLSGPDGSAALLIETVWDSDDDAREFGDACREMMLKRMPDAEPEETERDWRIAIPGRAISIHRDGDRVRFVDRDLPNGDH